MSIPNHLLQKILRYTTLSIQRLFKTDNLQDVSVKWKYGSVVSKTAVVSPKSVRVHFSNDPFTSPDKQVHRFFSFTRNHIYTESKAYCVRTGEIVESSNDQDAATATTFTPRGFITGRQDGSVWFPTNVKMFAGAQITVITLSQGVVYVGTEGGECLELDRNGRFRHQLYSAMSPITCICSQDGVIAIGSADGEIVLLDGNDQLTTDTNTTAFAMQITPLFMLTGHEDGVVRVWTRRELKLKRSIQTGGVITAMAHHGDMMAVGMASGLVELYDWQNGEFVKDFKGEHCHMITNIMLEDDLMVSASLDGQVICRALH